MWYALSRVFGFQANFLYIGTTDSEPLPATAADMKPDPKQIRALIEGAAAISPDQLAKGQVVAEQVCYLPMVKDKGCPLLGLVSPGIWAITGFVQF